MYLLYSPYNLINKQVVFPYPLPVCMGVATVTNLSYIKSKLSLEFTGCLFIHSILLLILKVAGASAGSSMCNSRHIFKGINLIPI